MTYIVKMDGMKVRDFQDLLSASAFARNHCRGKVEIVRLADCGRLPSASRRRHPNEDMPSLVYKPFMAVQ